MKHSGKIWWLVGLAALLAMPSMAWAQAEQRPISDFLEAQAVNSYVVWCTQEGVSPQKCVSFDAFGERAAYFGLDTGTEFAGSVKVRELADGTAHVTVLLHTKNAICWGGQSGVAAFGYSPLLVYRDKKPAALGSGLTKLEFTMPSVDTALPEFFQLMSDLDPDYHPLSVTTELNCTGALRAGSGYAEGTPGAAHVTQVWLNRLLCPAGDCWPAEVVNFRATGAR